MSGELHGKRIVLGVTGSIAAYKSALLLRLLQQAGATVQVVMTEAATRFVQPLTFATLSQRPVFHQLWSDRVGAGPEPDWSQHVQLGHWADLVVVAPATVNTLGKLANGLCDDALTAVLLSAACPVLLAPAMDGEMFQHPATQANLACLRAWGYHIAEPQPGYLASGMQGQGRMQEPELLLQRVLTMLRPPRQGLAGKRVLITAGPTQEPLDPVRYLTNHSSGKMGIALAEAAAARGATVTLVLGPTQLRPKPHPTLQTVPVVTAQQMFDAVAAAQAAQDVLIFAAAVADYRPAIPAEQKIKKDPSQGGKLHLELVENPDILAAAGASKHDGQFVVGFALETTDALKHGQEKLRRKHADLIVLNSLADAGAGFGHDTNQVTLLTPDEAPQVLPLLSKIEVAAWIWDVVQQRMVTRAART